MERDSTWKRVFTQLDEYNEEVISYWNFKGPSWSYSVTVREFISEWGAAKHVCISKELTTGKALEPTMSEKRSILKGIDAKDGMDIPIAFEIFPAKNRIVDRYDVYHLWLVRREELPFFVNIKPLKFVLSWKVAVVNKRHIMYTTRIYYSKRPIKVYFLMAEDGKELRWYDKQNFKDRVIGEDTVAIELVTDKYSNYSVLICVPKALERLPFGLR